MCLRQVVILASLAEQLKVKPLTEVIPKNPDVPAKPQSGKGKPEHFRE